MKYLPFGAELEGVSNIMVDSLRSPDTVLELSHWPGNRTPTPYKADTSTEIVLNFLRSPVRDSYLGHAAAVSNDHFDIDGLLAMWAVLHPDEALARADLLVRAAYAADFGTYLDEPSLLPCLALNAFEQHALQPLIYNSGWTGEQITGFLYRCSLAMVAECFDRPKRLQHLWAEEHRQLRASLEAFHSGRARLTEIPELDLAMIESDAPLHDYAVNAATSCLRVLTVVGGSTFCFKYRYESFVELMTRPVSPRIRLDALVAELNRRERRPGRWVSESVVTAHPRLQLYSRAGAPSVSSITLDQFLETLRVHLAAGALAPVLQWRAAHGWENEAGIPQPPSMRKGEASYANQTASDS